MFDTADQRIVRGAAATISRQFADQYGDEGDPGTVTVGVTRADGTELVAAGTATSGTGTNPRTFTLTAAQTARLDRLNVTWSVSGTEVAESTVDVVGGTWWSLATARAAIAEVRDEGRLTDEGLRDAITATEQIVDATTGVAWLPRFVTVQVYGHGSASVSLPGVMRLRSVQWCRVWSSDTAYEDLDVTELAAIPADGAGIARRMDGNVWPNNYRIVFGLEVGHDAPPVPLRTGMLPYLRQVALAGAKNMGNVQTVSADGVTYAYSPPAGSVTGIDACDRVLAAYDARTPGMA